MKHLKIPLVLFGLLFAFVPASAASSTGSLSVSARLLPQCSVSATNMNFGATNFLPLNTSLDATSTVTARCSPNTSYKILAETGPGGEGCGSARRLTHSSLPGIQISYYLSVEYPPNSGSRQLWGNGDGVNCPAVIVGLGNGAAQPYTAYGEIPAGQTPAAGTYTDTVVLSISY